MNKRNFRTIQLLSNISIIVIAVAFIVLVINQFMFTSAVAQKPSSSATPEDNLSQIERNYRAAVNPGLNPPAKNPIQEIIGKPLPLEKVDWNKNGKSIVLYISNSCHFCSESAPFYQRLVAESAMKGIKLIAILPQSTEQGKAYLEKLGVKVDEVKQDTLEKVSISGTPTLLIVNSDGIVDKAWLGKLSGEREEQVFSSL